MSAIALAAPAPTYNTDKDCAHNKPAAKYSDDLKGCMAYNADELKYKMSCTAYEPKVKVSSLFALRHDMANARTGLQGLR